MDSRLFNVAGFVVVLLGAFGKLILHTKHFLTAKHDIIRWLKSVKYIEKMLATTLCIVML